MRRNKPTTHTDDVNENILTLDDEDFKKLNRNKFKERTKPIHNESSLIKNITPQAK